MSQLRWTTQPGTISNMYVGVASSASIIAFNSSNRNKVITYQLIGGELPTGVTLSNDGILSGTPSTVSFDNTITYSFVVRARDSDLNVLDGTFTIILNNLVNNGFGWVTAEGDLGTVPNDTFYSLPLVVVEPAVGVTVSFKFISGELPPGMRVLSSGYLQGVPTLIDNIAVGLDNLVIAGLTYLLLILLLQLLSLAPLCQQPLLLTVMCQL